MKEDICAVCCDPVLYLYNEVDVNKKSRQKRS